MDYDAILVDVLLLIADAGRPVAFEQLSATAVDTAKPWQGPGAPTVQATATLPAVFVPVSSKSDLGLKFVSDDLLKKASEVCLVGPSSLMDLSKATHIVDDGVRQRVIWAQALKPGPLVVLYALGVAR